MYRARSDPLLTWPDPLRGLASSSLSSTLGSLRATYPLPPALLGRGLEPAVLRALNDLRETLSCRGREGASVYEACLRVSTQHRGGVWCVARRFGGRFVFLVIERCSTLNEMHEALAAVLDDVLWQVVL